MDAFASGLLIYEAHLNILSSSHLADVRDIVLQDAANRYQDNQQDIPNEVEESMSVTKSVDHEAHGQHTCCSAQVAESIDDSSDGRHSFLALLLFAKVSTGRDDNQVVAPQKEAQSHHLESHLGVGVCLVAIGYIEHHQGGDQDADEEDWRASAIALVTDGSKDGDANDLRHFIDNKHLRDLARFIAELS